MIRSRRFGSFLRFWWCFRIFSSCWKWHLRDYACPSPIKISWNYIVILRSWYLNIFYLSRSCAYWSHSCSEMHLYTSFISNFFFLYCIIVLRARSRISIESELFLFISENSARSISLSRSTSPFCHFPMIIILIWSRHQLIYFCKFSSLISNSNSWIISQIFYMIGFILSWTCHFMNCSFRWWVFHI